MSDIWNGEVGPIKDVILDKPSYSVHDKCVQEAYANAADKYFEEGNHQFGILMTLVATLVETNIRLADIAESISHLKHKQGDK